MARNELTGAIGWLLVLAVGFAVLRPLCSPKVVVPPDPNAELARAAREAVEMAREAQEEAAAVRASSGRWFFVSLAAAVIAPLVLAWLVFRSSAKAPPDDQEVLTYIHEIMSRDRAALPPPRLRHLAGLPEKDDPAPRQKHE